MLTRVRIEVEAERMVDAARELDIYEQALQRQMGMNPPEEEGGLILAGHRLFRTVTDEVIEWAPDEVAIHVEREDSAEWVPGWRARRVVKYMDTGVDPEPGMSPPLSGDGSGQALPVTLEQVHPQESASGFTADSRCVYPFHPHSGACKVE